MREGNRLWMLTAKQLAGKASPEELTELSELLRMDPVLREHQQLLFNWWNSPDYRNDEDPEQAFSRFLEHISQNHPTQSPAPHRAARSGRFSFFKWIFR